MERLAKRYTYNGKPEVSVNRGINGIICSNFCTSCGKADCENIRKALFKLTEYEDFEEIFRSKMTYAACDFLRDKEEFAKWLDRNKWIAKKCDEYARAEEQGKLLKLPCAVGDTVYTIYSMSADRHFIYDFKLDERSLVLNTIYGNFGKEVFLTREEAEAALKELEDKEE